MQPVIKGIKTTNTILFFDPNVFEFFVPRLTSAEEDTLLKEVSLHFSLENGQAPAIYVSRLYKSNYNTLNESGEDVLIQVLVTYSNNPILTFQPIVIQNKNPAFKIETTTYQRLSDIPQLFNNIKKIFYTETSQTKQTNEQVKIEGVKTSVIKGIFTAKQPPIPEVSAKPIPPITINENEIELHLPLLEKRFSIQQGTISNPLMNADAKRKKFNVELKAAEIEYTQPLEQTLLRLPIITQNPYVEDDELISTGSDSMQQSSSSLRSPLSKESRSELELYSNKLQIEANRIHNQIKCIFLQELYDKSSKVLEYAEFIEGLADNVKTLLKEYHYGQHFSQLTFIKRYLIWSLYHAALIYLNKTWETSQKKSSAKKMQLRQDEIITFNDKFKTIINIDDFCRLSSIEEAYAQFENLSLQQLSELTSTILKACDTVLLRNSNSLYYTLNCLREMNDELQALLGFMPFQISNSYTDKTGFYLTTAAKKFEVDTERQLGIAQHDLNLFNIAINTIATPKDIIPSFYQGIAQYFMQELGTDIKNIKIFKRILLEKQTFEATCLQVKQKISTLETAQTNVNPFMTTLSFIEEVTIEQLEKIHQSAIRTELEVKLEFLLKKLADLEINLNKNKQALHDKNGLLDQTLKQLSKKPVLELSDVNEIHSFIGQALEIQDHMDANQVEHAMLEEELKRIKTLFDIPEHCNLIKNIAANHINQFNEQNNGPAIKQQIDEVDQLYSDLSTSVAEKKILLSDPSLPRFMSALEQYINFTLEQINEARTKHNKLLNEKPPQKLNSDKGLTFFTRFRESMHPTPIAKPQDHTLKKTLSR